ncbi:MAG TPA: SRPBCC domain-containing protein [Terriglobales bacterium]|jgi:uncharacterized protein YndB with AHSA1/START domain
MVKTIATPDQDTLVTEIHIAVPPERVFRALTDPKQLQVWWNSKECPLRTFEMDARRGGKWRFATVKAGISINGVSQFDCEGEVTEYDPPRVLAYTWFANWHEDQARKTVVRWELSAKGGGTLVKVTHSGLAQEQVARKDYAGGWPGVVEHLKNFVEKNQETL